jgi:hypothetical protein
MGYGHNSAVSMEADLFQQQDNIRLDQYRLLAMSVPSPQKNANRIKSLI